MLSLLFIFKHHGYDNFFTFIGKWHSLYLRDSTLMSCKMKTPFFAQHITLFMYGYWPIRVILHTRICLLNLKCKYSRVWRTTVTSKWISGSSLRMFQRKFWPWKYVCSLYLLHTFTQIRINIDHSSFKLLFVFVSCLHILFK